jgi:hypothetical protein
MRVLEGKGNLWIRASIIPTCCRGVCAERLVFDSTLAAASAATTL